MLSVTTITSYLYCKRKLFLTKVLGFREPYKPALIKGTVRHETHELINKTEQQIVEKITKKTTKEQLFEQYKQHNSKILRDIIHKNEDKIKEMGLEPNELFKNTWPLILEESVTRAKNIYEFMETHLIYGKDLWEKLTPKIQSELRIESTNLGIRGIIDQIEIYKTGIVPIELKTGSCPKEGVWENHRIQAVAYALLAEEHFKQEVKEAFVYYLDHVQKRHIPINPFHKEEIKDLITATNALLNSSELPGIEKNQNKCRNCGLKDKCHSDTVIKTQYEKIFNRNI